MKKKRRAFLIVLLLVMPVIMYSQDITIRFIDRQTRQPLDYYEVSSSGTSLGLTNGSGDIRVSRSNLKDYVFLYNNFFVAVGLLENDKIPESSFVVLVTSVHIDTLIKLITERYDIPLTSENREEVIFNENLRRTLESMIVNDLYSYMLTDNDYNNSIYMQTRIPRLSNENQFIIVDDFLNTIKEESDIRPQY